MSTKLFNGYRLRIHSQEKLRLFTQRVSQLMRAKANQIMRKRLGRVATIILDERCMGKSIIQPGDYPHKTMTPLGYAVSIATDAAMEIRRTQQRDPFWDFEIRWDVYFHPKGLLVLFYSEQREFTRIWEAQPEVAEYGYWNNTDPLETISYRAWTQRGRTWDEALNCGAYSFSVFSTYETPDTSVVPSKLIVPAFKARCEQITREKARNTWLRLNHRGEGAKIKREGYQCYLTWMSEYRKFLDTQAGKQFYNEQAQLVAAKLPQHWPSKAYRTHFPVKAKKKLLPLKPGCSKLSTRSHRAESGVRQPAFAGWLTTPSRA